MLTHTTELAIKGLVYLAIQTDGTPLSHKELARYLGASPSYMAKVTGHLVRANILRAHRGTLGGVTISSEPSSIKLLAIVEACQGRVLADYCKESEHDEHVCGFHQAMSDLHYSIISALSRWTLADLVNRPSPTGPLTDNHDCLLLGISPVSSG